MRRINILVYIILIAEVFTERVSDILKFVDDTNKCNATNENPSKISTYTCTSITSTFKSTGIYKSNCCRLTGNWDPLYPFKKEYNENWKKKACEKYNVDESISITDLRKLMNSDQSKNKCEIIRDDLFYNILYSSSLLTIDGRIDYNCGSGDKVFYPSYFITKTEEDKFNKDMRDCGNMNENYNEKNCNKQGNKLITDKALCCWCETIYYNNSGKNTKSCQGYDKGRILTNLSTMKYDNMERKEKMQFNCKCTNNKNKVIYGSYDTVTNKVVLN
jgi:hypothetical protein